MPAVAQISVDFASRGNIISSPTLLPSNVKSISPITLTGYLLYNRELPLDNNGIFTPSNLSYTGGFITAGNRINVKHNDLQLLQNLDIGEGIYTDFIYSRRRDKGETYQLTRPGTSRSISLAPYNEGVNLTNYIKLESAGASKSISLYTSNTNISKLDIFNTSTRVEILLASNVIAFSANNTNISGNLRVDNDVTFNKNLTIVGSNTPNTELFKVKNSAGVDKFTVDSSSGNTDIQGTLNVIEATILNNDLTINKNFTLVGSNSPATETFRILNESSVERFTVDSANGNTSIQGTLNVEGSSTFASSLTMDGGGDSAETRRIVGLRRFTSGVSGNTEFANTSYDNDALSVGDFKRFTFTPGLIMLWGLRQNNIPNGWVICNGGTYTNSLGQNFVTPDLRNAFPYGTDNFGIVNTLGGEPRVTLQKSEMPSHIHSLAAVKTNKTGEHTHTYDRANHTSQDDGSGQATGFSRGNSPLIPTGKAGDHEHTLTGEMTSQGGDESHNNIPPFSRVVFIMYIGL